MSQTIDSLPPRFAAESPNHKKSKLSNYTPPFSLPLHVAPFVPQPPPFIYLSSACLRLTHAPFPSTSLVCPRHTHTHIYIIRTNSQLGRGSSRRPDARIVVHVRKQGLEGEGQDHRPQPGLGKVVRAQVRPYQAAAPACAAFAAPGHGGGGGATGCLCVCRGVVVLGEMWVSAVQKLVQAWLEA